jgi:mono/diheme cytochrome c family protein
LRENTTLRLRDPRNLIVSILDGIPAQNFPNLQSMQAMPGFADKLDDEQAARLVNYLRVTWGGQENGVTAATVHSFRWE